MPYNLVCCKAKWQIGLLNRNLHAGSQSCKAQVYKSLVLPILDYNHILKGYSILPPSLFTPIHPPPPPQTLGKITHLPCTTQLAV